MDPVNLLELSESIFHILQSAGISNAGKERDWILEEIGNISKKDIILYGHSPIEETKKNHLLTIAQKRASRYPLQYILGKTYFYGLELEICEGVLIPRVETELLVQKGIQLVKKSARILDIGCGSGAIAIALKYHREDLEVNAIDVHPIALEITRKNQKKILGEKTGFQVFYSDLFENVTQKMDAIFSNPPYLSFDEKNNLEPELFYEPESALFAGKNALDFYEKIASEVINYLNPSGLLFLEIGYGQKKAVQEIFSFLKLRECVLDQQNIERVLIFEKTN